MKRYTELVSRTPPAGLIDWAKQDLDTHGLIYQAVWVNEEPMGPILEERKPRKIKKVKVWCSACGQEEILDWCQASSKKTGYGFLHPGEVWSDRWGSQREYCPTESGDATLCPMCGSPVQVRKAAELWRWWFAPDETMKMSASVLEDGALVLTGWNVQLRVYRDGREEIVARPYDAYVFHGTEAAKLTGWRKSYSGNAGYFVEYKSHWDQPKKWQEGWGEETEIFGLTPELVASSQLKDCKLYEYMNKWNGQQKAPAVYLRLYQRHPNVENLVMSGLPNVLNEMIAEKMPNHLWEKNVMGNVELEEINWSETRPSRMLGLTREELRMARDMGWCLLIWRLYRGAKEQGEILSREDIQNAHYLGDENVLDLLGRGPVGKSLSYLLHQIEVEGGNPDVDAYVDPGDYLGITMLLDYWDMCQRCGYSLEDPHVRWPRNLCIAHDEMTLLVSRIRTKNLKDAFRRRLVELAKYAFRSGNLMIRPARSQRDLNDEAEQLSHCVRTYAESHASGETAIFFIRHVDAPKKSYFTLEFDEKKLVVRQNRGERNCARTPEVEAFEALWLSWVKDGCKRDKQGNPVLPEEQKKDGAA